MINALKQKVYQTDVWHKYFKSRTERDHWISTVERIVKWHEGKEEYVFPFPEESQKVSRYDRKKNAIMTFIDVETRHASYLHDLKLDAHAFAGCKVADIGSGPLPTLLVFKDCERYCVDHLFQIYRDIGYPLDEFESVIRFVEAKSECIPVADHFFDAIISRNALDHVDDFEKTCQEIQRVLRPGGYLHILVNYHQPTSSEPLTLSDERIVRNLSRLNMRKVLEEKDAWGFQGGKTVLWSNIPPSKMALRPQVPSHQSSAV